jgi:hypothetical protein
MVSHLELQSVMQQPARHLVEPASEFMRSFPQYRRLIPMIA